MNKNKKQEVDNKSLESDNSDKKETLNDVLTKLESEYGAKAEAVEKAKLARDKARDDLAIAQDELLKAYQRLTLTKENALVNTINSLRSQLNSDSKTENKTIPE